MYAQCCVTFMVEQPSKPEDRSLDLFFQLSSADRKRILLELRKENLHLNEVAKRLEMTGTETLRQLQRLTEARLLEKMADGKYQLTPYAKLVLDSSSPLDFISGHREYFLDHDVFLLPREFRARLGELSGCVLLTTAIDTFNMNTGTLQSAREKIDATIEVGFATQLEVMKQRIAEGVKVRWLLQESYLPKAREELRSIKKFPEMRYTTWLFGHLYQNENAADLQLRKNDGTQDYLSFYGKDPDFLRWANDFFEHEWKKAKPWYP